MSAVPVFAIITELRDTSSTLFGSIHDFCKELAFLCEQHECMFYVTSLPLFLETPRQGYVYKDGQWLQQDVPLPNVLHNRIHRRKTENSPAFSTTLQLLQEHHIPFFNQRFLNKWEVHEILGSFPYLQPFLPVTVLFMKKENLWQMLETYEYIFLKPIHGSQGRSIFRIYKKKDIYFMSYNSFDGKKEFTFTHVDELFQSIEERIGKRPYIIQQGLHLLTYEKKPLDFRILTHKKEEKHWNITSTVARISAENEFVSNLARGGDIKKIKDVLLYSFAEKQATQIKKLLYELTKEIMTCLDSSLQGHYGEFGIDLALDTEGNPWIIEINTKPSKNFLPSQPMTVRPSAKALFTYVQYLLKKE